MQVVVVVKGRSSSFFVLLLAFVFFAPIWRALTREVQEQVGGKKDRLLFLIPVLLRNLVALITSD
eukprot:scaffold3871_cov78-Skeletonema_dohrnii-CCMP3373.AAC.1